MDKKHRKAYARVEEDVLVWRRTCNTIDVWADDVGEKAMTLVQDNDFQITVRLDRCELYCHALWNPHA